MKPVRVLIFGTDDIFDQLQPYYELEVEKGNMEIIGYAIIIDDDMISMCQNLFGDPLPFKTPFDKVIISSQNNFMPRLKRLRLLFNLEEEDDAVFIDSVIDGRIFQIPDFDFPRFCSEGIGYGSMTRPEFSDENASIYEKIYNDDDDCTIRLGIKSYIMSSMVEGHGLINIDNFSCISWNVTFEIGLNNDHNHRMVSLFALEKLDWPVSKKEFSMDEKTKGEIHIGSDVWIGRGCRLKSPSPEKPLNIGNGAVVAADSVVVNDVPPFAIVGGNPAKVIKYRFDEKTIAALERIAWWNWSIEKIYENFHLFNNPEKFVKKFDPKG